MAKRGAADPTSPPPLKSNDIIAKLHSFVPKFPEAPPPPPVRKNEAALHGSKLCSISAYQHAVQRTSGNNKKLSAPPSLALVVFVAAAGSTKDNDRSWVNLCDSELVLPTTTPPWQTTPEDAQRLREARGKWIALSPSSAALVRHEGKAMFRFSHSKYVANFGLDLSKPFVWRELTSDDKCVLVTPCLAAEVVAELPASSAAPTELEWFVTHVGPDQQQVPELQLPRDSAVRLVAAGGQTLAQIPNFFVDTSPLPALPPVRTQMLLHHVTLHTAKDSSGTFHRYVCAREIYAHAPNSDPKFAMTDKQATFTVQLLETLTKSASAAAAHE